MKKGEMKKGFTLIELAVSIGLLAMIIMFSTVIFRVSIEAQRVALADTEIMQKLRAITDQLNSDFQEIRKSSPLLIKFRQETSNPSNRYDQMMFFATGDFQSIQPYAGSPKVPDNTGQPVRGNTARVYYGQAYSLDSRDKSMQEPMNLSVRDRLLSRRQHILTADSSLDNWPDVAGVGVGASFGESYDGYTKNDIYEHDSLSLAQWNNVDKSNYDNSDEIVDMSFERRPEIDRHDPNTLHLLMCSGTSDFAIQWAYWDTTDEQFYWFPSDDPDGDGDNADSHFSVMDPLSVIERTDPDFGVYFNISNSSNFTFNSVNWYPSDAPIFSGEDYRITVFPEAIKFSFTLYDSKGIIEKGKRFTHIVYLGD